MVPYGPMDTAPDPILVILHGLPPRPGAPVSGMGLRAWTNGEGLRSHGFDVVYATRRADAEGLEPGDAAPGSPANPLTFHHDELADLVARVDPAVILIEATDEVTRLPAASAPVVLDLFAPRLLERQFQGIDDPQEATRLLEAVGRADFYLFSNRRQRDYHLGLLTVAGVDCRVWPGAVVPLSCTPDAPRRRWPDEPVLVSGGVLWPWIDAAGPLGVVVDQLERRDSGRLRLFGGQYVVEGGDGGALADPATQLPDSERLSSEGFVPYEVLLHAYARATLAVDLTLPNPERELSFSFRHVDYLRCGLPMLLADHTVAADELVEAGAAAAVDAGNPRQIRRTLTSLLDDPERLRRMGRAARKLARTRHDGHQATAELARFCTRPRHRERSPTLLVRAAAERNRVADELETARNRGELLTERLTFAEERVRKADRERELAWRHFREASEQLERTWSSHGEIELARDRAWDAQQRTAADVERALEQRDSAWEAHGRAVAESERTLTERDRAWSAHDRALVEVDRLRGELDAAWSAHDRAVAASRSARDDRDAAWMAHDAAVAEARERTAERDAIAGSEQTALTDLRRTEAEREAARAEVIEVQARLDAIRGDLAGALDAVEFAQAERSRIEGELGEQISAIDTDRRRLEELLTETIGHRARRLVGRIRGRDGDEPL